MDFENLILGAKSGDIKAKEKIFHMYKPLLLKKSIMNGKLDEDLYQELNQTLLICIQKFNI